MPPNTATLRVGPYFLSLLLVFVALFGLVFLPGQRHTPKLGLDLEGGATVTLQAQTENGKRPSSSAMKVARQILENRVNGNGVSAAQVFQQSYNQIVISVPGANSTQIANIAQAAKLNFRPVVMPAVANTTGVTASATASGSASGTATPSGSSTSGATTSSTGTATPTKSVPKLGTTTPTSKSNSSPSGLLDPNLALAKSTAAKTTAPKTTAPKTTAAKTTAPTATTPTAATPTLSPDPFTKLGFALPTSDTAFNALTAAQQSALTAALSNFDCAAKPADVAAKPLAACDSTSKYLLGPVIVTGSDISSAGAVAPSGTSGDWTVSINLKTHAQGVWTNYTHDHNIGSTTATSASPATCSASTFPCADFVAFTLDGVVVSAPVNESTINGTTSVSGNFSASEANQLANDLKYGALPLNFTQLTRQDVSPTLGSSQLQAGLIAGGIGLILVVIYSFLYYRGLGFVTVASLIVSGGLTYGALVILGREIGFTLTLAGIAGFIVAVGITADSFVVLFERLKDEVHSGRSLRVAVPRAWTRARRTILSADTVSFLAAAVLYYFTVGDVRGFAFTLGLSTLLDIVVVFLFTHPLVSLLSRSKAFGSPRFTGLNSVREGGIAASPDAPFRSSKSRSERNRRGRPAGAVAVLERDVDVDGEIDDHEIDSDALDAPVVTTATDADDLAVDSGAPRRSRVVPRSAPPAEISADAAERAAARRGRTVRPPKPMPVEDVDDSEVEDAEDQSVDDAADDDVVGASSGIELLDDPETELEPGSEPALEAEPEPEPEPQPARAAQASTRAGRPTTAAERAAARRRRGRATPNAQTQPEPLPAAEAPAATAEPIPEPIPEPIIERAPEPEPEVAPEPEDAPEAEDAPETEDAPEAEVAPEAEAGAAPDVEAEPEGDAETHRAPTAPLTSTSRPTTAVERAAARRARIRSRAGQSSEATTSTDGEDES